MAQGDPNAAAAPHLVHESGAAQADAAAPAVDAALVAGAAPATGGGDELTWDFDIPLITDRFMLWEFFKVSGISALLVPILVGLMGFFVEGELVMLPWQVPVFAFAAMFVLFLLASLLLGNRHGATFHVDSDGVGYAARRRERCLNRLAIIVGVLGGSPTATGAGLLAASRETMFIPWEDVRRVKVYRGPRVIVLSQLFREVAARQLFGFVGAIGVVWHAGMLGISAVEPIQGIYETALSAVLDTEWLVVAAVSTPALLGLALFPWIWKR